MILIPGVFVIGEHRVGLGLSICLFVPHGGLLSEKVATVQSFQP
jgi:hypothetical protein